METRAAKVSFKQSIKDKWNKLTHKEDTGEVVTPIQDSIDRITMLNYGKALSRTEAAKLRATTVAIEATKIGASVGTGIVLGKTVLTTGLMAIGTYVVYDMLSHQPTQTIYKKQLNK